MVVRLILVPTREDDRESLPAGHKLVDVIIRPVAIDEEIPEHNHDNCYCQSEIISQQFRSKESDWKKGETRKYSRKKWLQDGDKRRADE